MTADVLRGHTRRELEAMARRLRLTGWHDMNKEELVQALARDSRNDRNGASSQAGGRNGTAQGAGETARIGGAGKSRGGSRTALPKASRGAAAERRNGAEDDAARAGSGRNGAERRNGERAKSSASEARHRETEDVRIETQELIEDSLTVESVDGRWIEVDWTLSTTTRERARAALGGEWRSAVPILRLYDMPGNDRNGSRVRSGDVPIDLDEGRWFVRTTGARRRFLVELGFRTVAGRFVPLIHSPPAGLPEDDGFRADTIDGSASRRASGSSASEADRLIPRSVVAARRAADGVAPAEIDADWRLNLQAELLLSGRTHPQAVVRVRQKAAPVNADGRFSLRVPIANGRVVLPAEVVSPDGTAQRMVVVAVDLNIREMEPQVFDETAE